MKKMLVMCLLAMMLVGPLAVVADDNLAQKPQANQEALAGISVRDDIIAMRREMERLSAEADSLATALQASPHAEAARKIQEHVTSLIQRTHLIEKKMDAENSGVMASFADSPAKEPAATDVKP